MRMWLIRQIATPSTTIVTISEPDDRGAALRDPGAHDVARHVVEEAEEDRARLPRRRELRDAGQRRAEQPFDQEHERERPHRGAPRERRDRDEDRDVRRAADRGRDERRDRALGRAGDDRRERARRARS